MISVEENLIPFQIFFKKNYNLKKLLNTLGNPENNFEVINVVGTNGKGSTSNFLYEGLKLKYENIGLFISPAFLFHNERIQVNKVCIGDDELKKIINDYSEDFKKYELTFFEIWTFIAIIYFNLKKINIAVIEAGIGGVKDATNVFENQKAICVTSLGFDHEEVLGNDIEKIVQQKLLIAKSGVKIFLSHDNLKYKNFINKINDNEKIYAKKIRDKIYFQSFNKGLAKTVLNFLNIKINKFKNVPLGRYTILNHKPLFIIDGCHNINGAKLIYKQIKHIKNLNILMAFSKNKNYENIISVFKKYKKNIFLTKFDHIKSWDIDKNIFSKYNIVDDWKTFLLNKKNENILVCGSLYFIPLVYKWFGEK